MSLIALNIKGLVAACVYLRSGLRNRRVASVSFGIGSGRLQPSCDGSFPCHRVAPHGKPLCDNGLHPECGAAGAKPPESL